MMILGIFFNEVTTLGILKPKNPFCCFLAMDNNANNKGNRNLKKSQCCVLIFMKGF